MKWIIVILVIILAETHARANWLSLCHDQPTSVLHQKNSKHLAHYLSPNESVSLLKITTKPADTQCDQVEIDLSDSDILWAGFASNVSEEITRIALQGTMRDDRFIVSEVILSDATNIDQTENTSFPTFSAQAQRTKSLVRSAWFWSPGLWLDTPERVFESTFKFGINRIYISVPTNRGEVNHPNELRTFIRSAHAHGLQVWALLGDPLAVMSNGVSTFLLTSAAYTAFNNDTVTSERLEGLQLDIEPYLIPGYSQNPEAWLSKYAFLINNIHQIAPDLQIDVALPFWFDPDTPLVSSMLVGIADSINRITIMDYRTDLTQIKRVATQFLNWGWHHKKSIVIALETLPIEQEDRRHYRQADSGELLQLRVGGRTVLLLLKDIHKHGIGTTSYRFTHTRLIDGTDISFFKRKDAFKELLPSLEAELSAWPSFSGLAVHGLDQW